MAYILICEDEPHIASGVKFNLEAEGHQVTVAETGEDALARVAAAPDGADLLILDVMLPGVDGFQVAQTLRSRGWLHPILMLTARGRAEDILRGFEAGADDYLPKPFDLDELEARVRALVRRSADATDSPGNLPARSAGWCGMQIDRDSGAVYHDGEPLELAPRELALLRAVLSQPGQAITKERLFELVFPGEAHVQPEAIEVVAYRLRKKIGHTGAQLVTLRGLGYLLKAAA